MPTLVQIDGWDPVAGVAVSLCAASHDDPAVCFALPGTWWPAIAKLPTLRYDLFDGAFGNQITTPSSSLTLFVEPWPNFARYILADAGFRLWHATPGSTDYTLRFAGRVSAQPKVKDGSAEIDFAVDDRWLDTSLLTLYAGTAGAEGMAALKGTAKPLAIGAPRYVPGKLIDSVNSVFQVHAYGAVQGFEAALERLARFSAPIGDFADYASLVAAAIPAGKWATARAVGMARFGAPPTGQVSFLLQGDVGGPNGWVRTPGRVIRRLALLAGGAGRLDEASLAALDTARPYNVSLYLDAQTTAREVIQKLAASVNAVAGVSWTGQLFVIPIGLSAPTLTLAADGSALPAVASVEQVDMASPFQKLAIGAERAWQVHALSDIAFTATVVDLGLYAGATTYREGNIANLPDGSRWLFVGITPLAGSLPQLGNANWSQIAAATVAVDSSGTPLTNLITAAQGSANAALAGLSRIGSDGYLNAGGEKREAVQDWQAVTNEASPLDAQADALSVDRTTFDNARSALSSYLSSLTPAWNDTTKDTPITASTWNGKWTDYYFAKIDLLKRISAAAATRSTWAGVGGTGKPDDNATRNASAGAWSSSNAYKKGDTVTSGGSSYTALQDVPAGTALTNSTYWQQLAAAGGTGATGPQGASPPLITITANPATLRFDASGNVIAGQSVTYTTIRQNTSDTPVFTLRKADGSTYVAYTAAQWVASGPSNWSSTGPDNLTDTGTDVGYQITHIGDGNTIVMAASAGGVTNTATVSRQQDGNTGATGPQGPQGPAGATSRSTAGDGTLTNIPIDNGVQFNFAGRAFYSNPSGATQPQAQLQWSYSGAGSWNTFASATGGNISPSEPGGVVVSGGLTNNTGSTRTYDVRMIATGSGPLDYSRSFIRQT